MARNEKAGELMYNHASFVASQMSLHYQGFKTELAAFSNRILFQLV